MRCVTGWNGPNRTFPDIDTGLLCCLMHKGENAHVNEKENFETVEVVRELSLLNRVLGLDLAGYEHAGDFLLYAPLFEKAHSYGIPYAIHAGEMGEGAHVMDALAMKANRIGHGINRHSESGMAACSCREPDSAGSFAGNL